jgi:hypothetical protein
MIMPLDLNQAERCRLFGLRSRLRNDLDRVNHQIAIEAKRLGLTSAQVRRLAQKEAS